MSAFARLPDRVEALVGQQDCLAREGVAVAHRHHVPDASRERQIITRRESLDGILLPQGIGENVL